MNKIIKIIIILAVIAGLVIGGMKVIKKAKAKDANIPKAKIYPIVVSHMSPVLKDVKLTLPFLAQVANDKDVKLSSRIAARILSIKKSGSSIKKGETIVKLDTASIRSNLQSVREQLVAVKTTLQNLKETHNRTLELLKIQGASIEQSQKEENSLASIKAQAVTLKQKEIELNNNLSYATIISPVDGVVAKTYDNKGAVAMPGKPLLSISSKNGFYLMLRVPTRLSIVEVVFHNITYPTTTLGSTFHGLAEYKVYIGDNNLTTGDRVEADVVVFNSKATMLPFDAFLNRDGKSFILLIKDNKATSQEVHIVQSGEQGVVISENLTGKDIVIAKPDILLKLTAGYPLKVKD